MTVLIAWCGFVGAWLLVAGPVYQAATELLEEGFERDELSAQFDRVAAPPRMSPWWWLLPPVAYLKRRRLVAQHRRRILAVMTHQQIEKMVRFGSKATGWLFVAGGAFFIAVKETWELAEIYEWPVAVMWTLIVAMIIAATVHTAIRLKRDRRLLEDETAETAETAPGIDTVQPAKKSPR